MLLSLPPFHLASSDAVLKEHHLMRRRILIEISGTFLISQTNGLQVQAVHLKLKLKSFQSFYLSWPFVSLLSLPNSVLSTLFNLDTKDTSCPYNVT